MENNPATEEGQIDLPAAPPSEPSISPGSVLAHRREELNLTVEQVAAQLNLAPRQIAAIEADNFAALPGIAIARGFVRSYAKLVRIDAEPLLAAMAPAVAPMPDARPLSQSYVSKPLAGDRLSFGDRNSKVSRRIWIVLAVVAAGVAVAAALQFGSGTMTSEAGPKSGQQDQAGQQGRTVEELPAPDVPAEAAPEPAPSAPPPAAPMPESAALPAAVPVKADLTEKLSAVDEKQALVLRMREQSWVEIKRGDGVVLTSRLFDAGTVEAFPLKGEMLLVVGNASGVEASLRGESLDLQTTARGNVARINVK